MHMNFGKSVTAVVLAAFVVGCGRAPARPVADQQQITPVAAVTSEKSPIQVSSDEAPAATTVPVPVAIEANVALPQGVELPRQGLATVLKADELPPVPFTEGPRPATKPAAEKRTAELDLSVPTKVDLGPRLVTADRQVAVPKPYTPDAPDVSRLETARLALPQLPAGGKRFSSAPNPEEAFLPPLSVPELERPTPTSDPGQVYARTVTQPPAIIGRGGFAPPIPLLPADPEENARSFRLRELPADVDPPARGRTQVQLPVEPMVTKTP